MKVLVLGSYGQLGRCLIDQLAKTDYDVLVTSREQIDIENFKKTKAAIQKNSPDVIINASAYTAVDKAEEEAEQANLINHHAVANIANICQKLNCWLIHLSTDYVFDGKSKSPYEEKDQTNPQGIYGQTKLNGELAIQFSNCNYIIIRTAWVYSEYGNNFLKTMLRLGEERDKLDIVVDQIGCPTYAQDIAIAIAKIIPQLDHREDQKGIYHFCGAKKCSWYEFSKDIFENAKKLGLPTPSVLNSIETANYPTPAKRPFYSVLNNTKIIKEFGVLPSDYLDGISCVLQKICISQES